MISNPYWDAVKAFTTPSGNDWSGPQIADIFSDHGSRDDALRWAEAWGQRKTLVAKYSWSVPDPPTVEFVVEHSRCRIIDPMAGTGYWSYLLAQCGVDCITYDIRPPLPDSDANIWHRRAITHTTVKRGDAVQVVAMANPARTLFLSWPPHDTVLAHDVLQAYTGNRLIYIGEGNGGCNAESAFFELLNKEWTIVAVHRIAQWSGMHDNVYVFDRIRQEQVR